MDEIGKKKIKKKIDHITKIPKKRFIHLRGNGIRVSFGMFNSEKDLDKLIDCIES